MKEEGEERENKDRRESKMRGRKLSQSGRGRSQEGVTVSLRTEVLHPPAKSHPRLFLPTETWGKYENNERERESYSKIWLSISRVNTNVLTLS